MSKKTASNARMARSAPLASAGGAGVDSLASFVEGLMSGSIDIIDLNQPLSERTHMTQRQCERPRVTQPPPRFANPPSWKTHEISRYDEKGPAWYWNWFEGGEHAGTHSDASIHWVTGKDKDDVSQVPVKRLIGPAVVIDKSKEAQATPDYLLTLNDIRAFERQHGALPKGSWLLYRTGWDARANDQKAFLNAN